MASSWNKCISRLSLHSLGTAITSSTRTPSVHRPTASTSHRFPLPSKPPSSCTPRFSLSRIPSELGCIQSLLPLHSAVAVAKMTSCLNATSRSGRALSQGT